MILSNNFYVREHLKSMDELHDRLFHQCIEFRWHTIKFAHMMLSGDILDVRFNNNCPLYSEQTFVGNLSVMVLALFRSVHNHDLEAQSMKS